MLLVSTLISCEIQYKQVRTLKIKIRCDTEEKAEDTDPEDGTDKKEQTNDSTLTEWHAEGSACNGMYYSYGTEKGV